MFRPISLRLTFHWGGMTPMRRLLSPGGSEQCYSTVWGQGSEETLLCPVGWAGKSRHPLRPAHLLHTHTLTCTLPTLRGSSPLSSKFWHEQLLRVKEWQVYSKLQQAHRREVGWQSSGITTWVEAVCRTKWAACLPASLFLPEGFLDKRSASPWMFTRH